MAETLEQKRKREEAEAAAKNKLPAPAPSQVQANLPNATVGLQTRGVGGMRLDQQIAPAGKELIGMKSGVPIYADSTDVYGAAAPQPASATQPTPAAETSRPAPVVNAGAVQTATPSMSAQQMRDAYQTSATASAVRAQQAPMQPSATGAGQGAATGGFFSKEYAQQFQAAQAAANQRAIDRIGAPRQDRGTSTTATTTNKAASALRNAAAQPRVATAEQVRAAGFGPKQTERLMFTENVTPDYLERLKNRSLRN